mmetsp:Transcript_78705/g.204470  ORF Transcript_78705/g.204470 Transcript_78705/m.204470 type:complete len:479 (+) Transcript_78705:58-1494(+)
MKVRSASHKALCSLHVLRHAGHQHRRARSRHGAHKICQHAADESTRKNRAVDELDGSRCTRQEAETNDLPSQPEAQLQRDQADETRVPKKGCRRCEHREHKCKEETPPRQHLLRFPRCLSQQLLRVAPGQCGFRVGLCLVVVVATAKRAGVRGHDMVPLLLARTSVLANPLIWSHRACGASLMRVRALIRVRMVHPLGEQPAMDVHFAAVQAGHLMQAVEQGLRQVTRCRNCGRTQSLYKLCNTFRLRSGRSDVVFKVHHEIFALVAAANRIELRRFEAIRPRCHVVRNDNHRVAGIRLVKGTKCTEIVHLLRKAPMAVQALLVEVRKPNATSFAFVAVHAQQRELEILALHVVECAKPLSDLHGHPRGQRERHRGGIPGVEVVALHASEPGLDLSPTSVPLRVGLCLERGLKGGGCGSEFATRQVNRQVRQESLVCICNADWLRRRQVKRFINCSETVHSLPVDEVLQGCSQSCKFV